MGRLRGAINNPMDSPPANAIISLTSIGCKTKAGRSITQVRSSNYISGPGPNVIADVVAHISINLRAVNDRNKFESWRNASNDCRREGEVSRNIEEHTGVAQCCNHIDMNSNIAI